ncbi:hypothetical protein B0H10DRAFT_2220817 [Mycena sp. CBHHK59/15]|nr:hypothetical protein B0H10DRAFT_2220817 [Mycena sp. CBHHK59/15]
MSAQNTRADQSADVFSPTAPQPTLSLQPQPDGPRSFASSPEVGVPGFPSGRTHLPTPQSPDYLGHYVNMQATPESPLAQASYMTYAALARPSYGVPPQRVMNAMQVGRPPGQQTMTPESSPYAPRYDTTRYNMTPAIPYFNPNFATPTPRASSSTTLQSPVTATRVAPPRTTTPLSSTPNSLHLSSPFMDKLTIPDNSPTPVRSPATGRPTQIPAHIDDMFTSSSSSATPSSAPPQTTASSTSAPISTPRVSPTPPAAAPIPLAAPTPVAGGEMERIRQAMMETQLAQHQEAEARRPDYLKRAKRPLSETDHATVVDDDNAQRERRMGIMDSPHKGRRITLFQETSEESFEESLMAGGYGRYRTADWVRQPQPMVVQTPGPPGPSNLISRLEEAEASRAPTEKELRKRKRLEAFRSNETTNTSDVTVTKLFPVNLEGKGRVLIDALSEDRGLTSSPVDTSPAKNGGKRAAVVPTPGKKGKRKTQEPSAREKKAMLIAAAALEDAAEKPNWPDAEFPWRLRSEERAENAREEEEQRMQWIEKFLDRDTDEEDVSDEEGGSGGKEDDELLPATALGKVYEEGAERPVPVRGGRGKMVPLPADPYAGLRDRRAGGGRKRSTFFPSDPADARAALLAKRSVRALSYRQRRRQREQEEDSDEEVLCICDSKDDNSEVVQCDHCQTWYHLHCIGIRNIAQLGREEDPWYCDGCVVVERSESSDSEGELNVRAPEPTFVPTDDEPARVSRSHDTPLFQPSALQDSPIPWSAPRLPTTPTRGSGAVREFGPAFSPASVSDSRHGPFTPSTPHNSNRRGSVQIFNIDTPGPFDVDDAPFDPTSTPSRGIKFGGPFTTPKNSWATRPNGLFQTPSKRRDSSSRLFGGPGTLDESAGGGGVFSSPFGRLPAYDDSPIRRDTAPAGDGARARRLLESPLAPVAGGRYLGHALMLEESPVMWSGKGKERVHDGVSVTVPVFCSSYSSMDPYLLAV